MGELRLAFPARAIAGKQRLTANDVALLRIYTFPEGVRTSDDIHVLLTLHRSSPEKSPEWNSFFIEEVAAFIIHHSDPQGVLDDGKARWIIDTFATNGIANSPLELELILHVMDIVGTVPSKLSMLALNQLHHALSRQAGAYQLLRPIIRNRIASEDIHDNSQSQPAHSSTDSDRMAAAEPGDPLQPRASYASRWLRVTNDALLGNDI